MDFISIAQLLGAISKQIALPDDWDRLLALPNTAPNLSFFQNVRLQKLVQANHNLQLSVTRTFFVTAYQRSVAARGLDAVLANHAEHRPALYDVKETGAPKKRPDVDSAVETILVHLANSFDQVLEFHRRTGLEPTDPTAPKLFAKAKDAQRLEEIGFSYQDLRVFFEKVGIDDPFQDVQRKQISSANEAAPSLPHITTHRLEDTPLGHPLRHLINRAKQTATDPNDYRTIWDQLVLMAQHSPPPSPMIRYVERRGIEYRSGGGEKPYTCNALRKYLNPAARGTKKKNQ